VTSANANIEAIYPLTPMQDGILFHTLYAPEAPLYVQQYTCLLNGVLDTRAFAGSWQHVIDRHQVLRSFLTWEGRDQPLQIVRTHCEAGWHEEDWRAHSPDEQEHRLEQFLASDRSCGFRLDVAPLMRFTLLRLSDSVHRFVWSHHHIIVDGWSMGLVLDEVFRSYEAFAGGREPELPASPAYRDYVRWLKGRDLAPAEEFWRTRLAGFAKATPLPIGKDVPGARWAERHAEEIVKISPHATKRLVNFARREGLTLNTVLRGAWALLLSRYSGEDDVAYGATLLGRPPELDGSLEMVGLFINTLPVRVQIPADASVVEWLRRVQQQQIEAAPFETAPLIEVQGWSDVPHGEPLFETLLVFENVPNPATVAGGLDTSDIRYLQRSNYPLVVLVMPGEELELIFLYDAERFDASIIGRLGRQLTRLLEGIADDPTRSPADVSLFPPDELIEILEDWNATDTDYPADRTIHALIEDMVSRYPEALAVTGSEITLTYAQLDARAATLAQHLRGLGVRPSDRIGVSLDRSPAMIVGILGILKAGGAYVPLDPGLPPARTAFLLDDTSARVLIVGTDRGVEAPNPPSIPVVAINDAGELTDTPDATSADPDDSNATPDDLAYVLYTSGSTGRPKGVAVTHRSLVNSTHARLHAYGEPVGCFLLLSPLIFDSSVAGIFSSLTQGGKLVLPAPHMEQDVQHLSELIARHQVTHTLLLPTLYDLLLQLANPEMLQSLQLVMVAGEACPPALVRDHYARLPQARLANEYGPTEATVWATVHHLAPPPLDEDGSFAARRVPIGRPIANAQAYILDGHGRPAPVGVPGELHIGGLGLAQGYLGQAEMTEERFAQHQIVEEPRVRLYRTGDIARFLPNGIIDLLGRADHQVKIRGQRVELGEIEMVLIEHSSVRDAAVVMRAGDGHAASSTLVAYVEATDVDVDELRAFVANRLPNAMVPTTIMPLEALPRGATGKVDRASLPDPVTAAVAAKPEVVAPRSAVEKELAAIWASVLGVDSVGATDNFFELGGDSILSIRIIARAHQAGLAITPKQFFDHPTVAGLAKSTEASPGSSQ